MATFWGPTNKDYRFFGVYIRVPINPEPQTPKPKFTFIGLLSQELVALLEDPCCRRWVIGSMAEIQRVPQLNRFDVF